MKCAYEKVITDIINGNNKQFGNMLDTPVKNIVVSILQAVQEMAEEEKKKQHEAENEAEEITIDKFYSDIPKGEAMAIVDEIIERVEDIVLASKLVRMFVNNRIPVDRVERILNLDYVKKE